MMMMMITTDMNKVFHLYTKKNLRMQIQAMCLFKFSMFAFWVVKQKSISNNKKTTNTNTCTHM